MGRWVVGIVACGLAYPSTTDADVPTQSTTPSEPSPAEPIATPAPAESSWYGTTRPERVVLAPSRMQHVAKRAGVFALGGLTRVNDESFGRIDIGAPVRTTSAPRLRAVLVSEFRYGTLGPADAAISTRNLMVTPELQYDWRLPSPTNLGDVVVIVGAGLRWSRLWVRRPDEPFWPSTWESMTGYAMRFEVAAQYRAHGGLLVSVLPLSVGLPLNKPEPPDARWMITEPQNDYAVSLTAGYQFP